MCSGEGEAISITLSFIAYSSPARLTGCISSLFIALIQNSHFLHREKCGCDGWIRKICLFVCCARNSVCLHCSVRWWHWRVETHCKVSVAHRQQRRVCRSISFSFCFSFSFRPQLVISFLFSVRLWTVVSANRGAVPLGFWCPLLWVWHWLTTITYRRHVLCDWQPFLIFFWVQGSNISWCFHCFFLSFILSTFSWEVQQTDFDSVSWFIKLGLSVTHREALGDSAGAAHSGSFFFFFTSSIYPSIWSCLLLFLHPKPGNVNKRATRGAFTLSVFLPWFYADDFKSELREQLPLIAGSAAAAVVFIVSLVAISIICSRSVQTEGTHLSKLMQTFTYLYHQTMESSFVLSLLVSLATVC